MGRTVGPQGASPQEWDVRVRIAARVQELLGSGSASTLRERLGDPSRTRAHKILNPNRERGRGQLITLALVMELADALHVSLVEFLAPWLAPGDIDAVQSDAHRRRTEEILERLDKMVDLHRARLDRPMVARLLREVAESCSYLTDSEVEYEFEEWNHRLRWRWFVDRQATGLPIQQPLPERPESDGADVPEIR